MSTNCEADRPAEIAGPRNTWFTGASFYYGWVMLPMAMVAHVVTAPGQSVGVSAFNRSFTNALGLTETQLTGAYAIGTLLACLPLCLVGSWMDRFGIRRTMAVVVVLFGGACMFAGNVGSLFTLFVAFFLLRLLGQGALSLLASNTPAMWFQRRLGTVTGLTNVGVVLLMGQTPILFRIMIQSFGWRNAYMLLGLGTWAIMLPLLWLFYRDNPRQVGQQLDGGQRPKPSDRLLFAERELTLGEALSTRAFWLMACLLIAWAMIGTGLVFNVQRLFESMQLTARHADIALMVCFTATAAAQLIGGWLADRVSLQVLITVAITGMTAGLGLLLTGGTSFALPAYGLYGAAQGLMLSAAGTLWVRYFGRAHVGKIRGTAQTAGVAGSALGPFAMGWCHDVTGSYQVSLWVFFLILAVLVPASLGATAPRSKPANAPA